MTLISAPACDQRVRHVPQAVGLALHPHDQAGAQAADAHCGNGMRSGTWPRWPGRRAGRGRSPRSGHRGSARAWRAGSGGSAAHRSARAPPRRCRPSPSPGTASAPASSSAASHAVQNASWRLSRTVSVCSSVSRLQVRPDLGGGELDLALGERQRAGPRRSVVSTATGFCTVSGATGATRFAHWPVGTRTTSPMPAPNIVSRRCSSPAMPASAWMSASVASGGVRNGHVEQRCPRAGRRCCRPPSWDGSVMRVTPARDPSGGDVGQQRSSASGSPGPGTRARPDRRSD